MGTPLDVNNLSQLKWACRRGMLELDVLLGDFLEKKYVGLSFEDKRRFISLLEEPDPVIFSWLMGHTLAQHPDLAKIVAMVRQHAKI